MREGFLKELLYKIGIIPIYSTYKQKRYDNKVSRGKENDKWYYKFLPIKNNKIVFVNFCGKGYGDNPKAIAEEIIRQKLDWDLVWLVNKVEEMPSCIRQVKYGSEEAMKELATAKLWVFNVRNVKHPTKRRSQKYLQTWHGGGVVIKPLEGMAEDALPPRYVDAAKRDGSICDYILSSDAIRSEVERKCFWLSAKTKILEFGTPKDDVFYDTEKHIYYNDKIRDLYNLTEETSIILYMPTFRDDGDITCYNLDYEKVIKAFENRFKTKCVLFVRLHPNVPNGVLSLPDNPSIIDVTSYPEANELLIVADYAISDYNNDAIAKMPLINNVSFIYAPDYIEYRKTRGLTNYYESLPIKICLNNYELVNNILELNRIDYFSVWKEFYKKYPSFEKGNASETTVSILKEIIKRG